MKSKKNRHKIKIKDILYNKDKPEKLSYDQAHQYIDDIFDPIQVKKDAENLDTNKGLLNTSKKNTNKALKYWVNLCEKHNYISDIESYFIRCILDGVNKETLFNLMKSHFIQINTLKDIDICEYGILKKIEEGIHNIQSKCVCIYEDPYINSPSVEKIN